MSSTPKDKAKDESSESEESDEDSDDSKEEEEPMLPTTNLEISVDVTSLNASLVCLCLWIVVSDLVVIYLSPSGFDRCAFSVMDISEVRTRSWSVCTPSAKCVCTTTLNTS